jgi:radical SAM protein with 4Fe4S-binding SPASM domain
MMSLECFQRTVDQFADHAYEVYLHNWGEPLLNSAIFSMIDYAAKKNLGTNMSSNLNTVRESDVENLVASRLEYLVVSLDGITEEVYQHYRRRGRFQDVFENLRRLIDLRNRRGKKTPFVEWQFIVMKHNKHQVDSARAMAKAIGVDYLRFIPVGLPFDARNKAELREDWFPVVGEGSGVYQYQYLQKPRRSACFYLYRTLTVNPDRRVTPCCIVYGDRNDFGDLDTESPEAIWNNEKYQSARALFSPNGRLKTHTVCERCHIFEQRLEDRRIQGVLSAVLPREES